METMRWVIPPSAKRASTCDCKYSIYCALSSTAFAQNSTALPRAWLGSNARPIPGIMQTAINVPLLRVAVSTV